MAEIGDEERQFISNYIATGNMEVAARGTIAPVDASPAVAKRTAMQAFGDSEVKAAFIEFMENAGGSVEKVASTLVRLLDTKKYALHQISGQPVEIGDDGMTQLGAAKTILQGMGVLGGGAKTEPTDQKPAPTQINIVFPGRDIRTKKEDLIIDGDDSYSARS